MTADNIVDIVTGLVMSQKHSGKVGPWCITLPADINPHQVNDKDETLVKRLHDIDGGIKEVTVGKGRGVSIEGME